MHILKHWVLQMCWIFQGIYIKSTYDGLHVITGTTENVSLLELKVPKVMSRISSLLCVTLPEHQVVSQVESHLKKLLYWWNNTSDVSGMRWFQFSFTLPSNESKDTVILLFSLLQIKPRGFMLEMKLFRSTNRQWWVKVHFLKKKFHILAKMLIRFLSYLHGKYGATARRRLA